LTRAVSVLRIVSWNVETLTRFLRAPSEVLACFGTPDVLCMQEIRVRPGDHDEITTMRRALPGYDCHFALADDPKNVTFRGGRMYGVVTYVRQALAAGPLATPSWDREGRVIAVHTGGLSIVNVYAVNGTDKPYYDHDLGRIDGDRHAFKRTFQRRLAEYADGLPGDLVLAGDWNVTPTAFDTVPRLRTEEPHATARRLFLDVMMPDLDVVDAFRAKNPGVQKFSWFRPNARTLDAARVDQILVSSELMARVRAADIDEEPEHRFGSDHAPFSSSSLRRWHQDALPSRCRDLRDPRCAHRPRTSRAIAVRTSRTLSISPASA
jgi:exodeoxyribonuclease-3